MDGMGGVVEKARRGSGKLLSTALDLVVVCATVPAQA
jgi:hypothetical protein